jgi:hypothetical protein
MMVIGFDSGGLSVMNCWNRDHCSVLYRDAAETSKWVNGKSTAEMVLAAFAFFSLLAVGSACAFEVPLTIWETAGVDRQQEICSTGVPLPCGLLHEPAGLAVFDPAGTPVPAQFRVLERWRDTGEGRDDLSIRWLLVTFLADVPAGKPAVYHLRRGKNPAPSEPLTIDQDADAYRMGGLTFRKDFTAPFAFELTDPAGKRIGTEGQEIRWSVWEDGPVRACLRAESETDHSRFGFHRLDLRLCGAEALGHDGHPEEHTERSSRPVLFPGFLRRLATARSADGPRLFCSAGNGGTRSPAVSRGNPPVYLMQASDGTESLGCVGRQ